jgi:hypothetical protein
MAMGGDILNIYSKNLRNSYPYLITGFLTGTQLLFIWKSQRKHNIKLESFSDYTYIGEN